VSEPSTPVVRRPARLRSTGYVVAEPLNVRQGLIGAPLATPTRRALAAALDWLLIALLTSVSSLWLIAALAVLMAQLLSRRGGTPRGKGLVAGAVAGAVLLLLAVNAMHAQWSERQARVQAVTEEAEEVLADTQPVPPASAAAASAAPAAERSASQRIAALEKKLRALEEAQPRSVRDLLMAQLDDLGVGFGWGLVYFSLLPAWWQGQTVGKRVLKLRVVELTGEPMTVLRGLRRYGGYAASMATGGIGFLQVLWDPNRQALQDRAAHTVVLDERPALPSPPPAPAPPAPPSPASPPSAISAPSQPLPPSPP